MIPFITRLRFRAGRLVFSPRRTCPPASPTSPSCLWTSTSPTPYKTAGKEDAKKTDNSVVKVKGCLIYVHVDINNLPPFPSDHQILIVLQCLIISWEKMIMEKIIQPKSKTLAVVQRQFFCLCGKYMRTILFDNRDDCRTICSAAIPFPAWQNPAKNHNEDDFWKPVVNCRTGNRKTKPNP